MAKRVEQLESVVIRFAGDSGGGMQLTGGQFTSETAVLGNDISTYPDFPAEIRAPAGSLPGVSGFQLSFSSTEIHTPGDAPDGLVAMNPAALKANLGGPRAGGRGAHEQAGRANEERLRPRADVLAVRAGHGGDARLDRRQVREAAG